MSTASELEEALVGASDALTALTPLLDIALVEDEDVVGALVGSDAVVGAVLLHCTIDASRAADPFYARTTRMVVQNALAALQNLVRIASPNATTAAFSIPSPSSPSPRPYMAATTRPCALACMSPLRSTPAHCSSLSSSDVPARM